MRRSGGTIFSLWQRVPQVQATLFAVLGCVHANERQFSHFAAQKEAVEGSHICLASNSRGASVLKAETSAGSVPEG